MNKALKIALKRGIIESNPCADIGVPKKLVAESKDIRCLTDEEMKQFIATARDFEKLDGLAIASLVYTGLRAGELCALTWDDVDFEKGLLNINKNAVKIYDGNEKAKVVIQKSTKTADGKRVVPLCKSAVELLKDHKEYCGKRKGSDFVLMADKPIAAYTLTKRCNKIFEKAGIKNATGTHILRHTFASALIRKGADIKVVSKMLGHSSITITYNLYVHILDSQKIEEIKLLDD